MYVINFHGDRSYGVSWDGGESIFYKHITPLGYKYQTILDPITQVIYRLVGLTKRQ